MRHAVARTAETPDGLQVVAQIVRQLHRESTSTDLLGARSHIAFQATATDRPRQHPPLRVHQQSRTGLSIRRPFHAYQRGESEGDLRTGGARGMGSVREFSEA